MRDLETEKQLDALCNQFEEDWQAIEKIEPDHFNRLLDQVAPTAQPMLLKHLIAVDVELRAAYDLSLDQDAYLSIKHDEITDLVQQVWQEEGLCEHERVEDPRVGQRTDEAPIVKIGEFSLIEKIGEGGMGIVYRARQEKPVRRELAVKVIRWGLEGSLVSARFSAERQALAVMDHPNIARLLDVGTTDQGKPYFAMELIDGPNLTDYCRQRGLGIREKLAIFVEICSAVHHAHQKGILHRDLKPNNILIKNADGKKPIPKIIDFGLAKVLEEDSGLGSLTQHTDFGQILGTLQYISPEQADPVGSDVDSRTDIYSLGIVLYELLTGVTPLNKNSLSGSSIFEILEKVQNERPVAPSKIAIQTDDKGDEITSDLDLIVMKALEIEKEHRYQSASEFGSDVQRFLDGDPIFARPHSAAYRLKKTVSKYWVPLAVAGMMLVLLVGGIVGTTVGMLRSRANAEQARLANENLKASLTAVRQGNKVLSDIFADLSIYRKRNPDQPLEILLASRLVEAGEQLDALAIQDPGTVSRLKHRLAKTLTGLGRHDKAASFLENAIGSAETRPETFEDHERLVMQIDLAGVYLSQSRRELAIELFRKCLTKAEGLKADQSRSLKSLALTGLAACYSWDQPELAIRFFERMIDESPDSLTWTTFKNYGNALFAAGHNTRAISAYQRALDLAKQSDEPGGLDLADCQIGLGGCYLKSKEYEKAEEQLALVVKHRMRRFGSRHWKTMQAKVLLTRSIAQGDDIRRAIVALTDLVNQIELKNDAGEAIRDLIWAKQKLAESYKQTDQPDKAAEQLKGILKLSKTYPVSFSKNEIDAFQTSLDGLRK